MGQKKAQRQESVNADTVYCEPLDRVGHGDPVVKDQHTSLIYKCCFIVRILTNKTIPAYPLHSFFFFLAYLNLVLHVVKSTFSVKSVTKLRSMTD